LIEIVRAQRFFAISTRERFSVILCLNYYRARAGPQGDVRFHSSATNWTRRAMVLYLGPIGPIPADKVLLLFETIKVANEFLEDQSHPPFVA
jgi:hypothetical protein